jgi:hypothetical protein
MAKILFVTLALIGLLASAQVSPLKTEQLLEQ